MEKEGGLLLGKGKSFKRITMEVLLEHKVHNCSSHKTNNFFNDKELLYSHIESVDKYVRTRIHAKQALKTKVD